MTFHYQEQFDKLVENCPPNDYKPLNIMAYRWIFDAGDARNFQSQFEKRPKRYNDLSDLEKCDSMALSMFNSAENAKKQFLFLKNERRMNENAYLLLGKHIAVGHIQETDGVNEIPANKFGHFNHHPIVDFNYHNQFKIVSDL
jgi:hypothetical protein